MKSTCYLTLIIVMLTVLDSTMGSESSHQSSSESHEHQHIRCDNLTRENINVSDLFRITSFTMTHAIGQMYNCSKAIAIKPISPDVDYSVVISSGSSVIYFDGKVIDCGKTVLITDCSTGMTGTWSFYTVNLESDTDGYLCGYSCSSDGLSLQQFNCVSAGNSVNTELTKTVIPYIKKNVPGADAIIDTSANCPAPKCSFFS